MARNVYAFARESGLRDAIEASRRVLGHFREMPKPRKRPVETFRSVNTIWYITIFGIPTSGNIVLPVTIKGTTENVTLTYNWTAALVQGAFAAHSKIGVGNVKTYAGPFPTSTIAVEFIGDLKNQHFLQPTVDFSGLGGGTGRSVVVTLGQKGLA